jgi:hypothetical protein
MLFMSFKILQKVLIYRQYADNFSDKENLKIIKSFKKELKGDSQNKSDLKTFVELINPD